MNIKLAIIIEITFCIAQILIGVPASFASVGVIECGPYDSRDTRPQPPKVSIIEANFDYRYPGYVLSLLNYTDPLKISADGNFKISINGPSNWCSYSGKAKFSSQASRILFEKSKDQGDRNSKIVPVAQRENCHVNNRVVNPSTQKKTIDLKQFGIQVMIPENYRTVLKNNGTVLILNPADYDLIVCVARGGFGGRGFYSTFIKTVPNPNRLELRKLINTIYIQEKSVNPYSISGIQGFIVDFRSRGGGGASYFVGIPGISEVLEIGASCDCEVTSKDLIPFLNSVDLIKK
jgi:hypothetical protein